MTDYMMRSILQEISNSLREISSKLGTISRKKEPAPTININLTTTGDMSPDDLANAIKRVLDNRGA